MGDFSYKSANSAKTANIWGLELSEMDSKDQIT